MKRDRDKLHSQFLAIIFEKKGVAYLWVFMVLVAAQEQAINTRNYQEVICGQQVESIFIQIVFAI